MTGTASTEAAEFASTYDLQVVPVPTNRPTARADEGDLIYKTEDGKFGAVVDDIAERYEAGQPVLVGTISVEKSEKLSRMLEKRGIAHEVLNAKQHTREAEIVAQAGRLQGVTVATNMAGRGVDILLGGNPEILAKRDLRAEEVDLESDEGRAQLLALEEQYAEETKAEGDKVRELGGLYVLGTERHESRRIDNQLRGRAGRQGDPGESRFYLSLEDDLMRLFATGAINWVMGKALPDDVPARGEDGLEGHRAGPDHRRAEERRDPQERPQVRRGHERAAQGDLRPARPDPRRGRPAREDPHRAPAGGGRGARRHVLRGRLPRGVGPRRAPRRRAHLLALVAHHRSSSARSASTDDLYELLVDDATTHYEKRESELGPDVMRQVERQVMLKIIDTKWREHLYEMDYLQEGINLRAMGQKDPLTEWQREGYEMFGMMMKGIAQDLVRYVMHVQVTVPAARRRTRRRHGLQRPPVGGRRRARGAERAVLGARRLRPRRR